MEWGNSAGNSDMRIRFRDDDPVGTRVQLANVVGVLTRRDQSGIASTYTLSISPGVQYGNVRIYCEDRERGGEKFCPTIAFSPGEYACKFCTDIVHYAWHDMMWGMKNSRELKIAHSSHHDVTLL